MMWKLESARQSILVVAVCTAMGLSGCATPQYMSKNVDDMAVKQAKVEISSAKKTASRHLSDEKAEKKVHEI